MPNIEKYINRTQNIKTAVVNADRDIIPTLSKNGNFPLTIAHFPDNGKPCFVGSAIKSNPLFLELARTLTQDESKRANEKFRTEVEKILEGDNTRKVATWSAKNKPNIFMLFIGEPFDPRSLRLYYTQHEFNGIPIIFQLAISRLKDSHKVEKIFEEAGYQGSKNWEKRKIH